MLEEQIEEAEEEREEELEEEASEFETSAQPEEPDEAEEPEAVIQIGPEEFKKAERARTTYRNKLEQILGAEAVSHECLMCAGLGYLSDLPPLGMGFTLVAGAEGPELEFSAPEQEPDFLPASDKAECEDCAGLGQVLTGSKAPHARLASCSRCAGQGWIATPGQGQSPPPYVPPAHGAVSGTPDTTVTMTPDAWGRPQGHPHWGVPPAAIPA